MLENNWPELTAYLIETNHLPDDRNKEDRLQSILFLLYPPDLDLNSKRKDEYAGKISAFMGHILHSYRSFCSKKRRNATRYALELLPVCQTAIYEKQKPEILPNPQMCQCHAKAI